MLTAFRLWLRRQLGDDPTAVWWTRLLFCASIGSGAFVYPFMALFYKQQGLSGAEIGALGAIGALTTLLAAPAWARLGKGRQRQTLQFSLVGVALGQVFLSQQHSFTWIALAVAFNALCGAAVSPALDNLALQVTAGAPRAGYGSIRVWGSFGWALVGLGSGWLIEKTSLLSGFAGKVLGVLASLLLLSRIRPPATGPAEAPQPGPAETAAPHRRTGLGFLRRYTLLGLALAAAITTLTKSGVNTFEPLYIKTLGGGEWVIGFASMLGAAIELPGMFWADRLIRQRGAAWAFQTGFIISLAGLAPVLAWPSVATILLYHAISGIAFSLYTVGMIKHIQANTPAEETGTVLALIAVTLGSLVSLAAGPLSGWFYDQFGAYWLYAVAAGGAVLCWLIFWPARHRERGDESPKLQSI
jgi:MFS family permease